MLSNALKKIQPFNVVFALGSDSQLIESKDGSPMGYEGWRARFEIYTLVPQEKKRPVAGNFWKNTKLIKTEKLK